MDITTLIWMILMFVAGAAVGALLVYKSEEKNFNAMLNQCAELREAEKKLCEEREEYRRTREMFSIIDDIPEYLKDKYDIPTEETSEKFDEGDEDYMEVYV